MTKMSILLQLVVRDPSYDLNLPTPAQASVQGQGARHTPMYLIQLKGTFSYVRTSI